MANILKVTPESAIKFFAYEEAKNLLSDDGKKAIGNTERFIAGAAAGVVSHVSMFPFEGVLLARTCARVCACYALVFI